MGLAAIPFARLTASRVLARVGIFAIVTAAFANLAVAAADDKPRNIYFLEGLNSQIPATDVTVNAFRRRLLEKSSDRFELFTEYLDLVRFPGKQHEQATARYLALKFAQNRPDLLVALNRNALSFLAEFRSQIAPGVPAIYCCTPAVASGAMKLPAGIPGIVMEYDWTKTLDLAEQLQPDAKRLLIILGSSDYDKLWEADIRRQISNRPRKSDIQYLKFSSRDALLAEVSKLPSDTIVLMSLVTMDASGGRYVPAEIGAAVASASTAPVYAPFTTMLGKGIVGGHMDGYEAHGLAAADLALQILHGRDPATLPPQSMPVQRYQVDARQLERWNLSEDRLPSDALLLFKMPTLWEQHRNLVIAAACALGLQTLIVVALLIQRRKRRQAERSLRESEDRMAFAAASTNTGLWQIDVASGHLWTTDHLRKMFALPPNEPVSLSKITEKIHPDERLAFADAINSATTLGRPVEGEYRVATPDGQTKWFAIRSSVYFDSNERPERVSGVFADVSRRKAAEAESESQRAELAHLTRVSLLGELSGAIAHELNQPLTAILANAQAARHILATESTDLETISEILDDIIEEDNRAGQVIHRMRSMLRKDRNQSERVNLNDLLESTTKLLRSEMIARGVTVDLRLARNLPLTSGDSVQLQQVLLNLLINGMDAMSETVAAQRVLTVATRLTETGYIEVAISDRGHGIGVDAKTRLFQPFFTTKTHGLGLGLSICSTIANSHGGRLMIDNNEDGGATAVFVLPTRHALEAAQ